MDMAKSEREISKSRSNCCCRCGIILVTLAGLVAAGGVLMWYFIPENVKPVLSSSTAPVDPTEGANFATDTSAQVSPVFNQCADPLGEDCCNGVDGLCDLMVSDVLFATLHNAMSSLDDGFLPIAANHDYHLEAALLYGYRGINVDIGVCDGTYKLLHGNCRFGTRDPAQVFRNIMTFLDNNPREVIIIVVQMDSPDDSDVTFLNDVYEILAGVDGFTNRMYNHVWPDQWPTLRTLIEADQRIVFFHFNGPRCTEVTCPPGFIDFFYFAEETDFSFDQPEDLSNIEKSCTPTRGQGGTLDFYSVNNFLTIPARDRAVEMNSREFLTQRLQDCAAWNSKNPNVNILNVDFWSVGDAVSVVQENNAARVPTQQSRSRVF